MVKQRAAKKQAVNHYGSQSSSQFPAYQQAVSFPSGSTADTARKADPPYLGWPSYLFEKMISPWKRSTTSVVSWMESWRVGNRLIVPKSESRETDTAYYFIIELPGIGRDQIALHFQDGTIMLQVEGQQDKGGNRHQNWRIIRRAFTIPIYTNGAKITAGLEDEVLTITIPKTDRPISSEPRPIDIL